MRLGDVGKEKGHLYILCIELRKAIRGIPNKLPNSHIRWGKCNSGVLENESLRLSLSPSHQGTKKWQLLKLREYSVILETTVSLPVHSSYTIVITFSENSKSRPKEPWSSEKPENLETIKPSALADRTDRGGGGTGKRNYLPFNWFEGGVNVLRLSICVSASAEPWNKTLKTIMLGTQRITTATLCKPWLQATPFSAVTAGGKDMGRLPQECLGTYILATGLSPREVILPSKSLSAKWRRKNNYQEVEGVWKDRKLGFHFGTFEKQVRTGKSLRDEVQGPPVLNEETAQRG